MITYKGFWHNSLPNSLNLKPEEVYKLTIGKETRVDKLSNLIRKMNPSKDIKIKLEGPLTA